MKNFGLLFLITATLFAQESHYTVGLGLGAVTYPSYVGSKSMNQLITPIPYIRYESETNSLAKGGFTHKFFKNNKLSLDLSLGAALPVESDNVPLRVGMEDLDFTLEIGPRLNYELYKKNEHEFNVKFPIRAVISTDIQNFNHQGFFVAPNLNYKFKKDKFQVKVKSGPLWADKKYHNYFYAVSSQDARLTRRAYEAKAGYNGYRNTLSSKYRRGSWNYTAFVSHINIEGATFQNSPLVETNNAFYVGAFVSYVFYEN
ncbi:MAG: Outer membrane protein [uncultured Sulfurovum sp.]|uniref:Outer membrane protein n=1 Tax=uncultured Sulfurovum sp. TaxID=269237 RepID=A0A6S6S5S7_9BACT|nr:MAG: Outer membrane protein [uncultured Sulfurovum sp.]